MRTYAARALDYGSRSLSDEAVLRSIILALTATLRNPALTGAERRYAARGLGSAAQNLTDCAAMSAVIEILVGAQNDRDKDVREYAKEPLGELLKWRDEVAAKPAAE